MRILTGGSTAIMCPAFATRHHDRWPRWYPRSKPKHFGDFESRCTKRVLWIVGSTDRHLVLLFSAGQRFRNPLGTHHIKISIVAGLVNLEDGFGPF